MIVVDTNNQTARNLSTQAVVGNIPRSRGEMQYIEDMGGKGILVQIGGNQKGLDDTSSSSMSNLVSHDPNPLQLTHSQESIMDAYRQEKVPMNQIDVFDVSSLYNSSTPDGTWYKQNTTGDTPAGRIDFCLALASSEDGSSHNIYMYGGRGMNGTTDVFYDEVWVLSLPSFTWTNVYQGSSPRYGHSCHRVGTRTMLTVGGAANSKLNQTPCDWETKGVGVFDMSAVAWGSVYDANAPDYTVPKLVASKIGSGAGGGGAAASMTQPTEGFDQEGLAQIFKVPYKPKRGNSTNSTSPPPSSQPQTSNSNLIGPVVGGLIGGLVLTGLLAALLWYYRHQIKHLLIGPALLPFFSELGDGRREGKAGAGAEIGSATDDDYTSRWELSGAEKATAAAAATAVAVVELPSPTDMATETEIESVQGRSCEMDAAKWNTSSRRNNNHNNYNNNYNDEKGKPH